MLGYSPIATTPLGAAQANEAFTLVAQSGTYALSLQGAGKLITDIYPSGTYILNGRNAALGANRPANFETGSFILEGQDVIFDQGYGIVAPSGSFTLTGQNAAFDTGFGVVWMNGDYTVTGQSINIGISSAAPSGSFIVTGQRVTKDISDVVGNSSLTMTLQDASITAQLNMRCDAQTQSLSGSDLKFRGFFSPYVPPEIWTEVA